MMIAATRAGSTSALNRWSMAANESSGAHAVIRHGEGHVKHFGQHRPEARLVGLHLAGERDAAERAAVKSAAERDDRRALRGVARDLDRVLDRLGARRQENGLLRRRSRRELVQRFGQRDVAFVRRDLEAAVRDLLELRGHRGLHVRMHVPGVDHGDAAGEVHVAAAFDVPELGVLRALGVHRERIAHATRNGGDAPLVKISVCIRSKYATRPSAASTWRSA